LVIPGFKLEQLLGEGGVARVFKAVAESVLIVMVSLGRD